ncbi:MAG: hypothetical protein ACYDCO_00625 [Armatimonadota bacterium]
MQQVSWQKCITWRIERVVPRAWSPRARRVAVGAALLLIALCWAGRAGAPVVDARVTGITRETPAQPAEPQPARDAWFGTPAPTPGQYARPTRAYRLWKARFTAGLAKLGRRQQGEAEALRNWLPAFEAAASKRAEQVGDSGKMPVSPLFSRRAVHRVIGPPPSPAFERFYGYTVVLPWNKAVYTYEADVAPLDSPYLVHAHGVRDGGTPVRGLEEIHLLFACAGVTDEVAKNVLIKVSAREGGFDAVNTWDTGYVSVGFIQFTFGEHGNGSLLHVLQRMKADEAELSQKPKHVNEFARYFTDHGIDVRDGHLYVRDPATGETKRDAAAVQVIIDDKRMTALFQDAGLKSRAFKLAQIREAYGAYYLADAPFRIPVAEVSVYQVTAPDAKAVAAPSPEPLPEPPVASPPEEADAAAPAVIESTPVPPAPVAPAATGLQLLRRRVVYGEQAVAEALAGSVRPPALEHKARASAPGTILRVARRMPSLNATYGEVLSAEGSQVTLTDRAVQHGVRSTMEYFATCLNALAPDHPLTLKELRQSQPALIAKLKNRIDVLAENAPPAPPVGGTGTVCERSGPDGK